MRLFYYGTWLTGLLSLVSILTVYGSNRSILRDLKRIPVVKNKWLQNYLQEYQEHLKNSTVIHNPAVYMTRRMRGRKIGRIPVRKMKVFSWMTFVLSFLPKTDLSIPSKSRFSQPLSQVMVLNVFLNFLLPIFLSILSSSFTISLGFIIS